MFVLAGLGNPGPQYALNRHNIGFLIVDALSQVYNFPVYKVKFNTFISEGHIKKHKVILCKPVTFMNRSGQALAPLLNFYKIPLENLYVVHDDLDLNFGRLKIKKGGGSGGHNGLNSIDQILGKDYWRLRVGIGHPGNAFAVTNYVLGNFTKQENQEIAFISQVINETINELLGNDPNLWLSTYSQRIKNLTQSKGISNENEVKK